MRLPALAVFLATFTAVVCGSVSARASYEAAGDLAQTLSLDRLPHEIGAALDLWKPACGRRIEAGQWFARISEISGRRYLTLHFEELACVDRSAICSSNGCRHEVYAFSNGRFHRIFTRQTTGLNLRDLQNTAVLELDCGLLGCLRALRWNGRTFLETSATAPDTEHIFGFTEGADVGLAGDTELEHTFTGRFGKPGHYNAIEGETALRHLWTDGLRTALTLSTDAHDVRGVPELADTSTIALNGLGGDLRWQLLARRQAPFALALGFEPQWHRLDGVTAQRQDAVALPLIALADVDILPDRLFAAFNASYTPTVARLPGGFVAQSALELSAAASVALRPDIFVGGELRRLSADQGAFLNAPQGTALFIGPSLFIALPEKTTLKLAWSAQITGRSSTPGQRLDLMDFERHQARLQVVKGF